MDLDARQPAELQRVADRPRVVRPGAGVEQDPVGVVGGAMELLDELTLVVGLKEGGLEPERVAVLGDAPLELEKVRSP